MIKPLMLAAPIAAAIVLAGCSTGMSSADYDKLAAEVTKASFQDKNLVKVDRLIQDENMALCSAAEEISLRPKSSMISKLGLIRPALSLGNEPSWLATAIS